MAIPNALHWLADIRNRADYSLRQAIGWRRPGLKFTHQPKEGMFSSLPQSVRRVTEARAAELEAGYPLSGLRDDSSIDNYLENLYYLDLLEKALNASGSTLPDEVEAADIGCSSWFYVQALAALLRRWGCAGARKLTLTGFEADPYRLYADFHSRIDHACAHIRNLEEVCYVPHPFFAQPGHFDLAMMLFPFVFINDALRWGLPASLFQPEKLLADAAASLKAGGLLIIVNQGLKEHERQIRLLETEGMHIAAAYRHEPCFYTYDSDRFVLVSRREQH